MSHAPAGQLPPASCALHALSLGSKRAQKDLCSPDFFQKSLSGSPSSALSTLPLLCVAWIECATRQIRGKQGIVCMRVVCCMKGKGGKLSRRRATGPPCPFFWSCRGGRYRGSPKWASGKCRRLRLAPSQRVQATIACRPLGASRLGYGPSVGLHKRMRQLRCAGMLQPWPRGHLLLISALYTSRGVAGCVCGMDLPGSARRPPVNRRSNRRKDYLLCVAGAAGECIPLGVFPMSLIRGLDF
jgi:hypothetical protein